MALRLSLVLALLGLFILLAFARPAGAEPVEIHYAPVENLEHVDVELLRSARAKIDMAAYSLTDWSIIDTLIDAHRAASPSGSFSTPASSMPSIACGRSRATSA